MIETSVRFGVTLVRVTFSGQATPSEGKEYQLQLKKKEAYALQSPFCTQWTRPVKDSKVIDVMESVSYESVIIDMVDEANKGRLNSNKVIASLMERLIPVSGDQQKKQSKKKKAQQEAIKQVGSVAFDLSYFVVPFEASSWKSVDFQLTATDEMILTVNVHVNILSTKEVDPQDIKDSHHLFALSSEQNSSPNSDQANNTNSYASNNETSEKPARPELTIIPPSTSIPNSSNNSNNNSGSAKSPRHQEKKSQALRTDKEYRHKPRRSRTIGDFEKESVREKANQALAKEQEKNTRPRRKSDEAVMTGERTAKVGQVIPAPVNTANSSANASSSNSNVSSGASTPPRHAKSTPSLHRNNTGEEGKGRKGKKKAGEDSDKSADAAYKDSDKSANKFALISSLTDLKSKFSSGKSQKSVSPRSERDKENRSRKNAVTDGTATNARGNNDNTTNATSTATANQTAAGEVRPGYGTVKSTSLTENKFVDVSDWNMTDWKTLDQGDKLDSILIKPPSISTSPSASFPATPITSQPTTPVNTPTMPTYTTAPVATSSSATAIRPSHTASHSHQSHLAPQPQPQLLKFKEGKGGGLQTSPSTSPRSTKEKLSPRSEASASSIQPQRTAPIPIPQSVSPQQSATATATENADSSATAATHDDSTPQTTPSPNYTNTTTVRNPVTSSNPGLVLPSPSHPSNAISPPLAPLAPIPPSSPRTNTKPKPLPSPRAHLVQQPISPRAPNSNNNTNVVIGALAIPSSNVTIGVTTVALATSPPSPRQALGAPQVSSSSSAIPISPPSPRFGTPIVPTTHVTLTGTTNATSGSPRTMIEMAIDAAEKQHSSNNNNNNANSSEPMSNRSDLSLSTTAGGRLRLTDNYTPLSFVVHGDWKPHAELLKSLGGKWVPSLASPPYKGWIFVAKRRDEVLQHIGHLLDHSPYTPSLPSSPRDLDFQLPHSTTPTVSTAIAATLQQQQASATKEQKSANDLVKFASQSNSSSSLTMTKSTANVNPYRFSCDDKIDSLLDNLNQSRQQSPQAQTAVPKLALNTTTATQSVLANSNNSNNSADVNANSTNIIAAPVSPHKIKGVTTPPTGGNRLRTSISMSSPPVSVERMIGLLDSNSSGTGSHSKERKTNSSSDSDPGSKTAENGKKRKEEGKSGADLDANLLGMIDDVYSLVTEDNGSNGERRELAAMTGASEGLERGEEAGVEILNIIEDILFHKHLRLSGSGDSSSIHSGDDRDLSTATTTTTDAIVKIDPERKLSSATLESARAKQMLKKLSLPILPSIPVDTVQEEKNAVLDLIHQFLKPLSLSEFTEVFFANGWTVPELYGDMTLEDLIELGFKKGHLNTWRKRVNSNIS